VEPDCRRCLPIVLLSAAAAQDFCSQPNVRCEARVDGRTLLAVQPIASVHIRSQEALRGLLHRQSHPGEVSQILVLASGAFPSR
jgi:hypothetical protein